MGKRVVLHIGTMKSGTSYVQSLLAVNAGPLDAAGVHVVGVPARGGNRPAASHAAANELVAGTDDAPSWGAVVEEVRRVDAGTVVVTSEFFGFLRPDGIRRAAEDLADVELTVVLGVRDQLTAVPAQWQSYTRNTGTASFTDYLRQIAGEDTHGRRTRAHRTFHRSQDVGQVLDRWLVPGVDRVAAFTVPAPGAPPEELWRRFVAAARLPDAAAPSGEVADNPSLGYESCDYLCRLNGLLGDLPRQRYRRTVRPLATAALLPLRATQGRPRLDRQAAAWAQDRNVEIRAALSRTEVELVGDLDDLPVDVHLDDWPVQAPPPDPGLVRVSALAALEWAAARAGSDVRDLQELGLDDLVARTAQLLTGIPK